MEQSSPHSVAGVAGKRTPCGIKKAWVWRHVLALHHFECAVSSSFLAMVSVVWVW